MNPANYRTIPWGWFAGLTAAASCLFLAQLAGQTPSPRAPSADTSQEPGTAIKTESRLVLVDAVVRDKKGNYVRNLTKDDFRVFEDNKEQPISSFWYGSDPATPRQEARKYLILLFDNSTMTKQEQAQARIAAMKFVDTDAGPDRLVAVVDFGGSYRMTQNFTANADLLRAALNTTKTSVVDPNAHAPADITATIAAMDGARAAAQLEGAYNKEAEFGKRSVLLSVGSLARNLLGFPGRKMVVLFSGGFPLSPTLRIDLAATIATCNRANVVIYAFDARGLISGAPAGTSQLWPPKEGRRPVGPSLVGTLYGGARMQLASYFPTTFAPQKPGSGGGTGGGGGTKGGSGGQGGGGAGSAQSQAAALNNYLNPSSNLVLPTLPTSITTNQQVLAGLALGTGGFTIFNSNDLLGGLEKVAREQNEFYLLGYVPHPSPEGRCHELKVELNRKGFEVRARPTYCNIKVPGIVEETAVEKQLEAHATGSQTGSLRAAFQLPYFYSAPNAARVNLAMEIPSDAVKFQHQEGKYHASLNVLGVAYKPDGSIGAKFSDTVDLNLEKDELQDFARQPYFYENQFDAAPGDYKFVLVLSAGGDTFGKFEKELRVEDYDGKQLSLGGVVLTSSMRKLADGSLSVASILLEDRMPLVVKGMQVTPSATNRFERTDNVAVYTEVYEPLLDSANPPGVAAAYNLFDLATGKRVYSTGAAPLDNFIQEGSTTVPVGMKVDVKDLPAGRYRLVMMAVDSLGHHATNRTVDFDITE